MSKFIFLSLIVSGLILLQGCEGCGTPPPTPYKAANRIVKAELKKIDDNSGIKDPVKKKINRLKTIVTAVPYLPAHLNPFLSITDVGYKIAMHQIYEPLIDRDPVTGKLVPALATSWQVEKSGKVYRFWIRKGVRWQDGRTLSVADVIFTFSLLTIPKIKKGPFIKDVDYSLMRIDKIGSNGVRIVLQTPNIYFLEHLPELPILPAHLFYKGVSPRSRASSYPMGTGPYRLYQWIRGKSIILEKNDFYWGARPEIERVVFEKIDDPAKAFVGIRRHTLDVLPKISPIHYPAQITANIKKSYKLYKFIPPDFSYLLWNTRNRFLSDFRVRRALSLLIDRKAIVNKIYRGLAVPCDGPFWRPGGLGDPKIKSPDYDPSKANILLNQVGWEDHDGDGIRDMKGKPMKLIVLEPVGSDRITKILEIIKNSFFKSGIDMVVIPTDWKLLGRYLKKRKFSAAYLTWRGRPYEDFSPIFHSEGRNNYSVIYSIFIDKLLVKMRKEKSFATYKTLSGELEDNLVANPPMAFLFRPVNVSIVHKRFKNVVPTWEGFRYATFKIDPNFKYKKK